MSLARIYQILKDPFGAKPKLSGGYNPDPISKYLATDNSQMSKWDPVATYNVTTPSGNSSYSANAPKVAGASTTKSSGSGGSSGGSSGGAPPKYDAAGHITASYKQYRDAQNASSGGGSSNSAAKDAEKMQIEAEKRAEEAQIAAEKRAADRAAAEKKAAEDKIIANLGKGWEDTGTEVDATGKSLDTSNNYINNLGTVRDQMLSSIEGYRNKTDAAIAGNKTLIEQNQKSDLDALAKDTKRSYDNTNVMLGVKGASGGSASKAAARAIAESAGKARAGVLTGYGDETSAQNQASKKNAEDYQTKRAQSYEWETTARKEALDAYNEERDALDRLKGKQSGWKDEDVKALSDRNLNTFLSGLTAIQSQARNFRDNLAAKMTEYGGSADALDVAAITVAPPSELSTPKFDENIDFTSTENSADWFDPNKQVKRVIKGYDSMGNPIYDDTAVIPDQPIV